MHETYARSRILSLYTKLNSRPKPKLKGVSNAIMQAYKVRKNRSMWTSIRCFFCLLMCKWGKTELSCLCCFLLIIFRLSCFLSLCLFSFFVNVYVTISYFYSSRRFVFHWEKLRKNWSDHTIGIIMRLCEKPIEMHIKYALMPLRCRLKTSVLFI